MLFELTPQTLEKLTVESLLILYFYPLLKVLLELLQHVLEIFTVSEVHVLEKYLHLFLNEDDCLQRRIFIEIADVYGFLDGVVEILLFEQKQQKHLLRPQFST
jgi:hypothetical protein